MSGSRPKPAEGHLAEQHLGDRLSALVDGELGHDARERVLAHVATCAKCRTEVDAQRRLKNVFAKAAPPPPSESFLARLQGLPAGGDLGGGSPLGGGGLPGDPSGPHGRISGVFGTGGRDERFEFAYAPSRRHAPLPAGAIGADRGFRIHDVSRPEPDRPASRGLRFAAAAAGAVSLAAIALGGVAGVTPTDTVARGSGSGSNAIPMRTQGSAAATAPDSQRRRGAAPSVGQPQGQSAPDDAPAQASAPLLPGVPPPAHRHHSALAAPVMVDAVLVSPLIPPLSTAPPLVLSTWETTTGLMTPGAFPTAPVSAAPGSAATGSTVGATATPAPAVSSAASDSSTSSGSSGSSVSSASSRMLR
ncbi:zf-HC2 domain-containing protein [Streptomyces sp. GDS52]|uniref:Zf-HC2 domain-containing protein n=1 Tax=Streptomyces cathayae TaxID=3031124 RepID=A0ABY8JY15_9ACTN|nr:zf-HC2 domain-containing protein [Streptomyces sp. HUAS 5]WGD40875.1 zf-HC2 domain-containing protein [Streptomyces sp. HUAS 5]